MPRIAVCTNYADRDKPHFSGENEHYDFCRVCYPRADAEELADRHGVPAEAVDFDVEHPSYDEWDYECCECNDTLTVGDNH